MARNTKLTRPAKTKAPTLISMVRIRMGYLLLQIASLARTTEQNIAELKIAVLKIATCKNLPLKIAVQRQRQQKV